MINHKAHKRFVKDFSLPIQILQNPYFEYYKNLYDNVYNSNKKYKLFQNTVNTLGSIEQFFSKTKRVMDSIIDEISVLEIYKKFNTDILDNYNVKLNIPKQDIYNQNNDSRYFLSIDLRKANYNALKFYDKGLVLDTNNYNEFISKYTDLEYIKQSKYIRQVIYGNLNPKKQQKIQLYIVSKILNDVVLKYFNINDLRNVSHDEIVVLINDLDYVINHNPSIYLDIDNYCRQLGIEVNIELFKLKQFKPYPYYIKEYYESNKVEFKSTPVVYFAQVYKNYFNMELTDYDLMFYYEGNIAKFLNKLEFEV